MSPATPPSLSRLRRLALGLGAGAFLLQVLDAGFAHLAGMAGKTQALAAQALFQGAGLSEAGAWMAWYLVSGVAVHAIVVYGALRLARRLAVAGPAWLQATLAQRGAYVLAGLAAVGLLMAADRVVFPDSGAGHGVPFAWLALVGLGAGFAAGLAVCVASWPRAWQAMGAGVLGVGLLAGLAWDQAQGQRSERARGPDIIVLGVDSLRPDHMAYFGGPGGLTPTLDGFARDAVVFENAYTTQARTFVAYMSVLSGQYPATHGARENLYPRELFERGSLLPHHLGQAGYHRVFSMDESRFANIDASFGFDQVASPPPGMLDFALGSVFDTAGTNLAQLLPGAWRLWPHVAGNRAAASRYSTSVATNRIIHAIESAPADQPLLLMAHFCMAHVPYAVGGADLPAPEGALADSPSAYRKALAIADAQVGRVLDALGRAGRLDNAVVVLLSDHGEGLGMAKDAWLRPDSRAGAQPVREDYGHGASALDGSSMRVFLGVARFVDGKPVWQGQRADAPASLVDVAPTLAHLAGAGAMAGAEGVVLVNSRGDAVAPPSRPVFVESGIAGASLDTETVDPAQVANEFAGLYTITQDGRFELDMDPYAPHFAVKQRGVVLDGWGVAAVPNRGAPGGCWVVADLARQQRQCVKDPAEHPRAMAYRALVCAHYARDAVFQAQWCQPGGTSGPQVAQAGQ